MSRQTILIFFSPTRPNPLWNSKNTGSSGFTLVELLVVMLLIGIILSFASLSIHLSSADQPLRDFAKRLHAVLELAQEEALLNNQVLGVELTTQGYGFYRLEPHQQQQWTRLEETYQSWQDIPEVIELELEIEGLSAPLKSDSNGKPQIAILPDGAITPFNCTLQQKDTRRYYQLQADLLGHLTLTSLERDF